MASYALAITCAIAFLLSNVYASKNIENVYSHTGNYVNPNDNTAVTWQDLRNEINQGDAITYELGAPQYQILNADEPIEIITPDQPGYYESLKRYEQAAEQTIAKTSKENSVEKVILSTASTTVAPGESKEQHIKNNNEKHTLLSDKIIRFIILNSKENGESSKIYLDVPKTRQQESYGIESPNNNVNKMVGKPKLPEKYSLAKQFLPTTQTNSKEQLSLQNSFKANNENQNSSKQANTTTKATKPDETTQISIVENMSDTEIPYPDELVMEESAQPEAMSTAYIPIEMPLHSANSLQPFSRLIEPNHPFYPAPPHITDFEYLYRSALGVR